MDINGTLSQVAISALRPRDWARVLCRHREKETVPAGVFTAGGEVVGRVHGPGYCGHGVPILVLLDPVLDDRPFFIQIEDIDCVYRIDPKVRDD